MGTIIPCVRKSDGVVGFYNSISNTFHTNAGSGAFTEGDTIMRQQDILYGSSAVLIENTFTMDGYTFTGWNTKSDGTGISLSDKDYVNQLVSMDDDYITLYAQWRKN